MDVDSVRHLVLSLGAMALSAERPAAVENFKALALQHKQRSLDISGETIASLSWRQILTISLPYN